MYNEICKNADQVYTLCRFSQDPRISINLQLYEKICKKYPSIWRINIFKYFYGKSRLYKVSRTSRFIYVQYFLLIPNILMPHISRVIEFLRRSLFFAYEKKTQVCCIGQAKINVVSGAIFRLPGKGRALCSL